MKQRAAFFAIALLAAGFRFPRLADRPMHCDEAVNADRLGTLLDQGRYEYSSVDFHGPTLFYVSALAARAQGIRHYIDLDEQGLRAVPAVLGVFLVAAHMLLVPYLGFPAAALAAVFTAVSPGMVYYSRYFIHETLFILLTFCAILSLFGRPTAARAVLTGALFGLMFATKETFVIPLFSMAAAYWFVHEQGAGKLRRTACAALAFLGTAALLMSSFLTHPHGLVDALAAYRTYLTRGVGIGTVHVHPWYFYLARLIYFQHFSEALLIVLAVAGFAVAIRQPGLPRFLAVYAILMVVVYSALPYKAPWNALGFLHAFILLAGIAGAWLLKRIPKAAIALLLLGVPHLALQARTLSFSYAADPRNPWVYAHTGPDVYAITAAIESLAAADPAGPALPVQIVTRENLWPLPWYLRRYPGVRWWNGVSDSAPLAPVVLATPDMEPALLHRIYEVPPPGQREMYVNLFERYVELRPTVEVRGYVAKSLWDAREERR